MKRFSLLPFLLSFLTASLAAQQIDPPTEPAKETPPAELSETPAIVARTAHAREWRWVAREVDEAGATNEVVHGFLEQATGMHWRGAADQPWQETVAEFVPVAGGFLAACGPHQAAVASDLSAPGSVTVVTPSGRTLRSAPALLALVNRVTGESLRLADLQPCRGELVAGRGAL